jgi:hypothetical protein
VSIGLWSNGFEKRLSNWIDIRSNNGESSFSASIAVLDLAAAVVAASSSGP